MGSCCSCFRRQTFRIGFYGRVNNVDQRVNEQLRFVQLTPPGSACSIAFGQVLTQAEPGWVRGMQVVIASADHAHAELADRGVPVSEVADLEWGRFVYFADPDGNAWALQELPAR